MTLVWAALAVIEITLAIWGDMSSAYRMFAAIGGAFAFGTFWGRVTK